MSTLEPSASYGPASKGTGTTLEGTGSELLDAQAAQVLLRPADVALRCSVSLKVVMRWIHGDGLPVVELPGSGARAILRVERAELDRWLEQRRRNLSAVPDNRLLHLAGRRLVDSTWGRRRRKN